MKAKIFILLLLLSGFGLEAQMSINTDGTNPDSSAMLDVKSTEKGFLMPRMSIAQRNAISNPAEGLLIYQTDGEEGFYQYSGTEWKPIASAGTGGASAGNAGIGNNYGTVVNNITGKVWLDRNLGASHVATAINDTASYGDLYQWGRSQNGHEARDSDTSGTQAWVWTQGINAYPWDGKFITGQDDWLGSYASNTALWTGTYAENNPCPSGFRLPTNAEWVQECLTWSSLDNTGAFASVLKLPAGGNRIYDDGSIYGAGGGGYYWSSTVQDGLSIGLIFEHNSTNLGGDYRASGYSVRCIKD